MAIISNLIARLSCDSSAFERGTSSGRKSLRGLADESNNTTRQLLGLAKGGLELLGIGMTLQAVKSAFAGAYREAASFQTGMAKVSTMLDAGQMKMLPGFANEIRRMSIAYGESTTSLGQGAYDIIGSAIAPSKAMGVLEASVVAAKGGFTDTATVTKAVVGILNAYGMEAEKAGRVTDILQMTVKNGVVSFEDLAAHVGTVTGIAGLLGVDLEAVGASIATMTRSGMSAEIALTALRNILSTFMNPTEAARKTAAELGFTLDENSIKGAGLITVMEKLRGANGAQLESLMPNIRGQIGFATQLKNSEGLMRDYQAILESAGTSQEMFNKVSETAALQAARAAEAYKSLKMAVGDVTLGALADSMNAFSTTIQNNQAAIRRWVSDVQEGVSAVVNSYTWAYEHIPVVMAAKAVRTWTTENKEGTEPLPNWVRRRAVRDYQQATGDTLIPENNIQNMLGVEYRPKYPEQWQEILARTRQQYEAEKEASAAVPNYEGLADFYGYPINAPKPEDVTPPAQERPYTEKQTDYLDKVNQEISGLRFEADLLGKTNAQRQRATMFRQLETDAMKVGLDFRSQEFALQRAQLEASLQYYEKQQKIAEVGAILGTGLADSFRGVTAAIIQSGNALEALRQVALNTLASIQNALVWKPLENMATTFATNFLGNALGSLGGGPKIGATGAPAGDFNVPISHAGGMVGSIGLSRSVPSGLFMGASRFHLGSDEVPSILQRGERVTSRSGVTAERASAGQMISILSGILSAMQRERTMTLVDYRPNAEQYMSSKDGEKKVMYHVQRNGGRR